MSSYSYNPQIIVLPEDRANEEIANGFIQAPDIRDNIIKIERPAGGWRQVIEKFIEQLIPVMQKFQQSLIVLLIDFDQCEGRFSYVKEQIPNHLTERVFILGILSEPEGLKKDIRYSLSREKMGESLAKDCPDKRGELWEHELLKHNKPELDRLIEKVKAFLFI